MKKGRGLVRKEIITAPKSHVMYLISILTLNSASYYTIVSRCSSLSYLLPDGIAQVHTKHVHHHPAGR